MVMLGRKWFFIFLLFIAAGGVWAADHALSLAGEWRYELDRQDVGERAGWPDRRLPGRVRVPVDLAAQGIGDDISIATPWTGSILDSSFFSAPDYAAYRKPGSVKVPFWLQPEKYYIGAAWYQRDIFIPKDWADRRVELFIERPHWETRVWIDDRQIGRQDALATPHLYELTGIGAGKHRLTIRIDNRMIIPVGANAHSVSDHTQGNWNGMVGRIELLSTPLVWIKDLQVFPNIQSRSVLVKGQIGNLTGSPGWAPVSLVVNPGDIRVSAQARWDQTAGDFSAEIHLGETAVLWDEFNPFLYQLSVKLQPEGGAQKITFGLREISTQGTQFLINGRKTFIRGTLECAIFPKTGHPPTDLESWKRIILVAKAHGLNNFRFHSWCPPDAAFKAADELGFYLQVECSSWANHAFKGDTACLGDGLATDAWIYAEAERILQCYGNHPSFLFMLYGNEPGGKNKDRYLRDWVNHFRALDSRRLYSGASGWPKLEENQFHVVPDPRIQAWGKGLKSRVNAKPPETVTDYQGFINSVQVPVISHEIGQWCVYPNFREKKKCTGYLKPKNFDIFYDRLKRSGLHSQARSFLLASGKLQALLYKEEIESALRTPGMAGFQLLDLHDFPGQGTALVGVLDPFWEEKGYISAAEYRRFCNSTVLLARMSKRVFTIQDTLTAQIEIAHFGSEPLRNEECIWALTDAAGRSWAQGSLMLSEIPVDNATALGSIITPLTGMPSPGQFRLVVSLRDRAFENDWDIWIYPAEVESRIPPGVMLSHKIDDALFAKLQAGGKALLCISPQHVKPDAKTGPIAIGFSSIFWNTAWTSRQAPHTLGILCDPSHPALTEFPTAFHSNWQWWYLISRAGAMILNDLPQSLNPIVSVIDDWYTARRLGLIFEARVDQGKILVCSIDLSSERAQDPVTRQMLFSLLNYMNSEKFSPKEKISTSQLRGLVNEDQDAVR